MRMTASELEALTDDLAVDAYADDEQLSGFLVGADEALRDGERAHIAGVEVEVLAVDAGPDCRTGLLARVRHGETTHDVTLSDLVFDDDSELGRAVASMMLLAPLTADKLAARHPSRRMAFAMAEAQDPLLGASADLPGPCPPSEVIHLPAKRPRDAFSVERCEWRLTRIPELGLFSADR